MKSNSTSLTISNHNLKVKMLPQPSEVLKDLVKVILMMEMMPKMILKSKVLELLGDNIVGLNF